MPVPTHVDDFADLRDYQGDSTNSQVVYVNGPNAPHNMGYYWSYLWFNEVTVDDDDVMIFKPTAITGSGRWVRTGETPQLGGQIQANWIANSGPAYIKHKPDLADVATTGSYNDLLDKPSQANSDWNATTGPSEILNKPTIPSGQIQTDWSASVGVSSIANKPTLFSGVYADLSSKPALFSGSYTDLTGKPTIPAAQVSSDWTAVSGAAAILNKPTIPASQVQSDWNASSGIGAVLNKPVLATVAVSGSYADLSSKPTLFSGAYPDLTGKPTLATIATSGAYSDLSGQPVIGKAMVGTTAKTGSFRIYQNATVASGVAVFQLTDNGLSGGNALFANEVFTDSVQVMVSDATASYQMAWAFSNSNKTLTVTANKLTTANILTGLLGQTQANGAVVKLMIEGR